MRQTCKCCGMPHKFCFDVPDDVWEAVVPASLITRVVCLECFDDLARKKDVSYAAHIKTLYFAGDGAAFEFRVVAANDVTD